MAVDWEEWYRDVMHGDEPIEGPPPTPGQRPPAGGTGAGGGPPAPPPPPGGEDLFDEWGGMENWLRDYAAQHGGMLPGMPGAESWESAMASLAWSREYAGQYGRAPSQQEWEKRWFETQGWSQEGDWRAWVPTDLPTPWWQRMQQAPLGAAGPTAEREAPPTAAPGAMAGPEMPSAMERMGLRGAEPPAPGTGVEYFRTRQQQLEEARQLMQEWSRRAVETRGAAGGVAMPRMEYAVSPSYPSIMDPSYRPSALRASETLSTSVQTGTLPYTVPEGAVRRGLRIPVGSEETYQGLREAVGTRWDEMRPGGVAARRYPEAEEAMRDIGAMLMTAVSDYLQETRETWERAGKGEEGAWYEQFGVPVEKLLPAGWDRRVRQVRALTHQVVVDAVWDWPIAVATAFDQAWGTLVHTENIKGAQEDLDRLRELEAMGITDTSGLMEAVEEGKPFSAQDFRLLTEWGQDRARTLSQGDATIGEWQDVKDLYQQGRLGWTFNQNPERFQTYLESLRDPAFDMERFINEYADNKAELIGAVMNPVNFILPPAVDAALFPAGRVAGPVLELGLKGAGKVLRKIPVLSYLTEVSKASTLIKHTDEAYDMAACLTLRAEAEGVSKADVVGRLMLQDDAALRYLPESMHTRAREIGTRLHEELTKRKKSASYEDLWEYVYPGVARATDDPTLLAELVEQSEPAKVIAAAYRRAMQVELGIKPLKGRSQLEQRWRYAGAVLKDNWLSLNGAFHVTNDLGDRTRMVLRGIDPFKFPSQEAAERTFTDYGLTVAAVERTYIEDIIERVVGEEGPTSRLPVPLVGKPEHTIEAMKNWLGFDPMGKGPLAYAARVTKGIQPPVRGSLGETVGRGWAWLADKANLGTLNDIGAELGNSAEAMRRRTTAIQLFTQKVEGPKGARAQWFPEVTESLRNIDLPDVLREHLEHDLRRVKNPTDVRTLVDRYLELPDKPLPFVPAGESPIDANALDYLTDQLTAPDGGLVDDVNQVFDMAREFYDTEYKWLALDGVDTATGMHKFFDEYFMGLGDAAKPKDVDLAQRLRGAIAEERLKNLTMYDVPETYLMARVGDVAEHGETAGIFNDYFQRTYLTREARQQAAKDIIADFNKGTVTQSDIMESFTEAYNTTLTEMGVARRYEYKRVVPLPKGAAPGDVGHAGEVYKQWLGQFEPEGKGFAALSDGTRVWSKTTWEEIQDHWQIADAHKLEETLMDLTLISQDDSTRSIVLRAKDQDQAYRVLAQLDEMGVPPGTRVDMMWPEVGEAGEEIIGQGQAFVGGMEPSAAQRFMEASKDPSALAEEAMQRKELDTFARETGTELELASLTRPYSPEEEAARTQELTPGTGYGGLQPTPEEAARRTVEQLETGHQVLTPRGTGTVREILGEESWNPLVVVDLADGTTEQFTREFVSRGEPTLATQEEAVFQAWQAYNDALKVEWRADIEQRAGKIIEWLEDWRDNNIARQQSYIVGQWKVGGDREALAPVLEQASQSWSEHLEKARLGTIAEMHEIMFDYSRKTNIERHMEVVAPFTTYQFRSIPFFAKEAVTNWRVPRFFDLYDRWTEMEREKRGLTSRFKGTFPMPFQKQLQERGVIPEGYYGMDPKSLMLWQGSMGQPFESPGERQQEGLLRGARQVATAPENIGVRYWPWLQMPMELAGVYGPRETGRIPWQIGGTPSRLFPQVEEPLTRFRGWRPVQAYQEGGAPGMWQDLAETMSTPSQENWVRTYYINKQLAAMAQAGKISSDDARAAQYDPSHPLYQEAMQQYDQVQRGTGLARLMSPFGIKYSSPEEQQLHGAERLWPGVPELWWRARQATVPPEEREALFAEADRRRDYFSELRGMQAERDQQLQQLRPGTRPWQQIRKQYTALNEQLAEKYADVIEKFPGPKTAEKRILAQLDLDKFELPDGSIDWEAYEAKRDQLYAELEQRITKGTLAPGAPEFATPLSVEQQRVGSWTPQRIAYEQHERRLREGQEQFFAGQEEYDTLQKQLQAVRGDRALTSEERRRQEQLIQDKLDAIRAEREGVMQQYGPRSLAQYWPEVQRLRPELEQTEELPRLAGQQGAGLQEYWLRNIESDEEALGRSMMNAFYAQGDAAQFTQRRELGPDFAAWLRGEGTPSTQQLEYWTSKIPGARSSAQAAGAGLGRRLTPAGQLGPAGGTWAPREDYPTPFAPPTPEYEQTYATATQHMRDWRLGERQDWSEEMQQVFGDQESPRSQWFEEFGRVMPYVDWESLNADRDAQALLSGKADDRYYEDEAAAGFPTLMKYVDQARLGQESEPVRQAADAVQAEWPSVPDALTQAQTEYFGQRTGYDREKWKQEHPDEYQQLQSAWDEQTMFQWENPEYAFIHRPENFHRWWGDQTPEEVRANLDKNKALISTALADMRAYQQAKAGGERGEWTDAMAEVFEDPDKASVKYWGVYHQIPPGSFGQPIKQLDMVQWINNPLTKQYVKWEIPDDLYKAAMTELQQRLDEYNADPNVPHLETPEEVDHLWALRDKYFRIRNYEEEYPGPGAYDPARYANDNPLLLKWYPYFDRDWGSRPMNPHTGYAGGGSSEEGGGGGVGPAPSW